MTKHKKARNTPKILTCDLPIFYALFLSVVRFATEKYGGTMATDLVTGSTRIHVPHSTAYAYMEEIRELMGPGRALNDLFCLLDDWKTFPTITVI